jgi:D-alanyl-D-alanine carboxypeptidase/D-alanyl-D-alanine-endopeptidase (penicillin-binding protein 4)
LVFHAETLDGRVLASSRADEPFNPASVVKVGTSLWALDRYGPSYRYATSFGSRIRGDDDRGILDLVVVAGGDPDLQRENVFLVAAELARRGLTSLSGDLVVSGDLWCGWERGVERRIEDPVRRAPVAGALVREALDPRRWSSTTRATWNAMAARRGLDPSSPARVAVAGGVRYEPRPAMDVEVVHRSNPLPSLLKRFNVYSNNDIVRIADVLGGVPGLETFLVGRLGPGVHLSTASGERTNRMTARQATDLMRDTVRDVRARGLEPGDVLPVLGCDPGPTRRMFPAFLRSDRAGAVAVKTGSLTTTDGGVAVLAGVARTRDHGDVVFSVAATNTGRDLRQWRQVEQSWLLDLLDRSGGVVPAVCGPDLPFSDEFAEVVAVGYRSGR